MSQAEAVDSGAAAVMEAILWAVPRLYFRLTALTEDLCRHAGVTPGKRSLMRDVAIGGPARIADMARVRPVARQYVQRLVAELEADALVRLEPAPDDGRSKLVMLTDAGHALVARLDAEQSRLMPALLQGQEVERLRITSEVLADLIARCQPPADLSDPAEPDGHAGSQRGAR